MIFVATVIGIIEDEIANSLTGNNFYDSHIKARLESIKDKVKKCKDNIKYEVKYRVEDEVKFHELTNILKYEFKNKFLLLTKDNGDVIGINIDTIEDFAIIPMFKEEVDKDDNLCSSLFQDR